MSIVYIFSALSVLYGLSWLVFAFVQPPPSVAHYYRSPGSLYFLPDIVSKLVMAALFIAVLPGFATFIVGMFMR